MSQASGSNPQPETFAKEAPDTEGIFISRGDEYFCLIPLYKRNPLLATVIGVGSSKESATTNAHDLRDRLRMFLEKMGQDPRV